LIEDIKKKRDSEGLVQRFLPLHIKKNHSLSNELLLKEEDTAYNHLNEG